MKQYDVFISYRRSSYESANLIATRLKAAGYRVFFDLETMRSGPFNEQLFNVIEKCNDFVLVLPPEALERCHDEGDWVRKEVLHAMEYRKNIIPVLLNGFQWPEVMPSGMEKLCMYQGVAASIDYFDLAMTRLESYLKSRKHTKQRIFARWTVAILLGLMALSLTLLCLFRSLAKPVCKEVVDNLTLKVGLVDLLLADNNMLAEAWEIYELQGREEMEASMETVRSNMADYEKTIASSIDLSSWQKFLLSFYGTNSTQLADIDEYIYSMYSEMNRGMELIKYAMSQERLRPSEYEMVRNHFKLYLCLGESLYYTYLSILNESPKVSLEGYYQLAPMFENMPKTGLGLKKSEYELLVTQSYEKGKGLNKILSENVSKSKDELYEAELKLDSINQAALAQYRAFVERMAIKEVETLYNNWGKVQVLASMLTSVMQMQEEILLEGGDMGYITPQLVLSDINKALDDINVHYEVAFVESVKAFYEQVLNGMPMGGVLIYDIAQNKNHEVYQIGDIIVEWNGERTNSLKELKQAYSKSSSGKLKLLRLDGDSLKKLEMVIPGNEDIVAFVDLVYQE